MDDIWNYPDFVVRAGWVLEAVVTDLIEVHALFPQKLGVSHVTDNCPHSPSMNPVSNQAEAARQSEAANALGDRTQDFFQLEGFENDADTGVDDGVDLLRQIAYRQANTFLLANMSRQLVLSVYSRAVVHNNPSVSDTYCCFT